MTGRVHITTVMRMQPKRRPMRSQSAPRTFFRRRVSHDQEACGFAERDRPRTVKGRGGLHHRQPWSTTSIHGRIAGRRASVSAREVRAKRRLSARRSTIRLVALREVLYLACPATRTSAATGTTSSGSGSARSTTRRTQGDPSALRRMAEAHGTSRCAAPRAAGDIARRHRYRRGVARVPRT